MVSVEELTDRAIQALIAQLPAQLAAMETQYAADPIKDIGALPVPRSENVPDLDNKTGDYWPGGVTGPITRWPTVEVAVPDLDGQDFSLDQHESDVTPTIIVRAWLSHVRADVLYRQCCRYGAAIYNVLVTPDATEHRGSGFGAEVTVRRYSARWRFNPEQNTRDEIESAVVLIFYLDAPDVRP